MDIVTGMHRSGTSLVAHLLSKAGAEFGPAEQFYPADKWNPDGYYEQRAIHSVNFPLVNGLWWKFSYLALPGERRILRRAERIRERIESVGSLFAHAVVKDPRFCLTMPAWRACRVPIARVLICIRNPVHVAQSLKRRDRLPLWFGYRLWSEHNVRLAQGTSGLPVWYVRYERLVDPDRQNEEVDRALRFMNLSMGLAQLTALSRSLIRRPPPEVCADAALPARVAALWESLCEMHERQVVAVERARG